jgi:hypothetical protein
MLQCNKGLTRARRNGAAIAGKQRYSLRMAAMLRCKTLLKHWSRDGKKQSSRHAAGCLVGCAKRNT